jgi:diacylglycerol kinase family enzyme
MLEPNAPLFIVLNAASGSGDAALAQTQIREELELAERQHEFFVATRGAEVGALVERAAKCAREQKGALIAAGGDGTINSAARAVLKTGRPLGIIPQGTFNFTTRAHAIPTDTRAATRALLTGRVRRVQVGLLNEYVFLVNAGVGMHPELLEEREAYKAKLGRYRAVAL